MIEQGSHSTQKSVSLNDRQNLTEMRVVCTTAWQWRQLIHQPWGLKLMCQNQRQKLNDGIKI